METRDYDDGGRLESMDTVDSGLTPLLNFTWVRDGVGNIWRQPLPSGTPTQLTDFTTSTLYNFAWSWDGKQLAVSRGDTSTDVVLFAVQPQS